ncbi:hypothetical protein ASG89_11865 [Paenibacillus sp. Soil766]|uniref:glycosyltransferase n=1 Tax=Paenibacillus sp. Soil766 TaxID=1736404 RepID=UPI00070BAAFD|nr:glycosyltransferase [Paenibacillus sp. Soil766]KRE83809.1 hypothetical protein ASG89_11865 [Paenibacillus sp. Soil766]
MKPKRILVVGLSKNIGGIENLFINILNNKSINMTFDFLIFDSVCEYEDVLTRHNCRIYYCTRRGKNPLKSALVQRKIIIENGDKYEYIWNNISSASDILIYYLVKKYTNAKIITHSHGENFESDNFVVRFIHLFLHNLQNKYLGKKTDYYFACSEQAGRWLFPSCLENQILEIKNGIDVERFKFDLTTRKAVRENLGISDKLVLGHVGRLCRTKNQRFLIETLEEVVKYKQNVVMLLIGNGEDYTMLKNMVQKKNLEQYIRFLGARNDVHELLQALDVFLLPSLFEGFPLSIVEAQASGLNCIVSDTLTTDVDLTDSVKFISLDSNEGWENSIANIVLNQNRNEFTEKVKISGYDIKDTVKEIERYLT